MGKRHDRLVTKRAKAQTNKIVSKLTYSPAKHKNKVVKHMRMRLQQKTIRVPDPPQPKTTLKFGSFNVNGLDLEVGWAVQQLIMKRGFDVIKIWQALVHAKEVAVDFVLTHA